MDNNKFIIDECKALAQDIKLVKKVIKTMEGIIDLVNTCEEDFKRVLMLADDETIENTNPIKSIINKELDKDSKKDYAKASNLLHKTEQNLIDCRSEFLDCFLSLIDTLKEINNINLLG